MKHPQPNAVDVDDEEFVRVEAAFDQGRQSLRTRVISRLMFTVNRLGVPVPLERCLNSTNIIESVFSGSRRRWRRTPRRQRDAWGCVCGSRRGRSNNRRCWPT